MSNQIPFKNFDYNKFMEEEFPKLGGEYPDVNCTKDKKNPQLTYIDEIL